MKKIYAWMLPALLVLTALVTVALKPLNPTCAETAPRAAKIQTESSPNNKPMTICFYLHDGVEILDFAGPMEVFTNAGYRVFTVARKKGTILSQGVLNVVVDYGMDEAPEADIMAFFGGNASRASSDDAVIEWLNKRKASTRYFFSVCTGAFFLGRAGLLDGRTVTTFHQSIPTLRQRFPKANVLEKTRYVEDGNVITTAGISAGIDGALHLVSRLSGEDAARRVVEYMEYDVWKPNQGLVVNR